MRLEVCRVWLESSLKQHRSQKKQKTARARAGEHCSTAGGELDPAEAIRTDGRPEPDGPRGLELRYRSLRCEDGTPRSADDTEGGETEGSK